MLFGLLQTEPTIALKDVQLLPSYTQLVDITPKRIDVQRLIQISRLSKLKVWIILLRIQITNFKEESQTVEDTGSKKLSKKPKKGNNSTVDSAGLPSKGVYPTSFTSLYDKISTGWFKSWGSWEAVK